MKINIHKYLISCLLLVMLAVFVGDSFAQARFFTGQSNAPAAKFNAKLTRAIMNHAINQDRIAPIQGDIIDAQAEANLVQTHGLTTITTCGSNERLRWDSSGSGIWDCVAEGDTATSAFAKIPLPVCGAGELLTGDGTNFQCAIDQVGAGPIPETDPATLDHGLVDATTCDASTDKLRWTGSAFECVTDVLGGFEPSTETDPNAYPHVKTALGTCNSVDEKIRWTGSAWGCAVDKGATEIAQIVNCQAENKVYGPSHVGADTNGCVNIGEVKVQASDAGLSDEFGTSVAISGDYMVVGTPNEDTGGSNVGAVYVFKRTLNAWNQADKLQANDITASASFGKAVAIEDSIIVVGAPGINSNKGAVYTFTWDGASFVQFSKIEASDGDIWNMFGESVSISGDYIAVGASGAVGENGKVYVYKRDGAGWVEEAIIQASDTNFGWAFGIDVDLDGDTLAVGANLAPSNTGKGKVYVYKLTGATWATRTEEANIISPANVNGDQFAMVAIDGDYMIVGTSNDNTYGSNAGIAYVYKRTGTTWALEATISASDAAANKLFGKSVDILGKYVVIGATVGTGDAYIFRRDGVNWNQISKITASDAENADQFGSSVALSKYYATVGAHREDTTADNAGSVYIYPLP